MESCWFWGRTTNSSEPKYLNSPESKVFSKEIFYLEHITLRKNHNVDNVILCEGYMDVLHYTDLDILQ